MKPVSVPAALVAAGLALVVLFDGVAPAARPAGSPPAGGDDLVARLVALMRDTPVDLRWHDAGWGLIAAGLTVLAIRVLSRGAAGRTPRDRGLVVLIGAGAWIVHAIAWTGWCIASLDGIGAFRAVAPEAPLELLVAALGAGTMLGLVSAPLPCAAFVLLAWGRDTPAPMRAAPRDARGWIATVAAALALALLALHTASACAFGAVALVPPAIVLGWAVLAVRAIASGGAPPGARGGEASPIVAA